jgi:hypothetical protein
MDFDQFVERLYKIGWRAVGDAQHTQIRELWGELVEDGLRIHLGGLTPAAPSASASTSARASFGAAWRSLGNSNRPSRLQVRPFQDSNAQSNSH